MAHARRKFHDLYAHYCSDIAEEALRLFSAPYEIGREARDQNSTATAGDTCDSNAQRPSPKLRQ